MRMLRNLLLGVAALSTTSGFAQLTEERDYEELSRYLRQRQITFVGKGGAEITLSGDVRVEYKSLSETFERIPVRGSGSNLPAGSSIINLTGIPTNVHSYYVRSLTNGSPDTDNRNNTAANQASSGTTLVAGADAGIELGYPNTLARQAPAEFDVEFNLALEYHSPGAWAEIKLEFDNDMGVFGSTSGSSNKSNIALEKALFGYMPWEDGAMSLCLEMGRAYGDKLYYSPIQFGSLFDGLHLKYANSFDSLGDFHIRGGAILMDEIVSHYAYVVETGLSNIRNSGFKTSYSLIDWSRSGVNRYGNASLENQFMNSQLALSYACMPSFIGKHCEFFGGYLLNHAAEKLDITSNQKKNAAYFLGARVGKIEKAGDLSVQLKWEHLDAQSVPDWDVNGMGRGNVLADRFYDQYSGRKRVNGGVTHRFSCAEVVANSGVGRQAKFARGNANYKGWGLDLASALTDNLTLNVEMVQNDAADKAIGGRHAYKKTEIEMVYAF